jgi:hypothetical protein
MRRQFVKTDSGACYRGYVKVEVEAEASGAGSAAGHPAFDAFPGRHQTISPRKRTVLPVSLPGKLPTILSVVQRI